MLNQVGSALHMDGKARKKRKPKKGSKASTSKEEHSTGKAKKGKALAKPVAKKRKACAGKLEPRKLTEVLLGLQCSQSMYGSGTGV
jgi:hypothetical protein